MILTPVAVERKVSMCGSLSEVCEDEALDGGIELEEIAKCIRKLKNSILVVVTA